MAEIPLAARNAIIAAGLTIMSTTVSVSGYWWGKYIWKRDSTTQVYVFKGYSNSGVLQKGFACLCKKVGTTPFWKGEGNDSVCNNNGQEKVVKLNSSWVPSSQRVSNIDPPAKSCCKNRPKVNGATLPGIPAGENCWIP